MFLSFFKLDPFIEYQWSTDFSRLLHTQLPPLCTFLLRRNLKRAETSFGSHSSRGRREHLRHLQPGLGGLWDRGDWDWAWLSSLDLLRLKDRADSGADHQDLLSAGLGLIVKYTKTIIKTRKSQ